MNRTQHATSSLSASALPTQFCSHEPDFDHCDVHSARRVIAATGSIAVGTNPLRPRVEGESVLAMCSFTSCEEAASYSLRVLPIRNHVQPRFHPITSCARVPSASLCTPILQLSCYWFKMVPSSALRVRGRYVLNGQVLKYRYRPLTPASFSHNQHLPSFAQQMCAAASARCFNMQKHPVERLDMISPRRAARQMTGT